MGGEPAKFEVPTTEISREAFFNIKGSKPTPFSNAVRAIGKVTSKVMPFPLPGLASTRLSYLHSTPSQSFVKQLFIGTAIGVVFGGIWRFWHTQIYQKRTEDYFKQLAIANNDELESFRRRLISEGAERRATVAE